MWKQQLTCNLQLLAISPVLAQYINSEVINANIMTCHGIACSMDNPVSSDEVPQHICISHSCPGRDTAAVSHPWILFIIWIITFHVLASTCFDYFWSKYKLWLLCSCSCGGAKAEWVSGVKSRGNSWLDEDLLEMMVKPEAGCYTTWFGDERGSCDEAWCARLQCM